MLFGGRRGQGPKPFVAHFAACGTDDCQLGRQQSIGMERTQGRQQHALREVAGGAEDQELIRALCHWSHAIETVWKNNAPRPAFVAPAKPPDRVGENSMEPLPANLFQRTGFFR
jgi:hypothetical protein